MRWIQVQLPETLHETLKAVVSALSERERNRVSQRDYLERCVRRCVATDCKRLGIQASTMADKVSDTV
jgi:hypothetical protein